MDELLDTWMDLGPTVAPSRIADVTRVEIRTTHQRRASWWPPAWRDPSMNTYAKLAFATLAVAAVAIVGLNLLRGQAPVGPTASPSATPTAEPSESLPVLPNAGRPAPGIYTLGETFPTFVTIEVPEGWQACGQGSTERGICPLRHGGGVGIWSVTNVVADPCPAGRPLEPAVGPSVEDLVAALSSLEGFTATQPSNTTVDGFSGQRFMLTAPPDAGVACGDPEAGFRTWVTPVRINGAGPGEINEVTVLDVDGVRVMLTVAYHPEAVTEQQIAAMRQVARSIHFVH